VGELEGGGDLVADLEDVVAVLNDVPVHAVALGALGEARAGRGAFLAGAHRVAVVLDDEDDGQRHERREVVGLVHGALVDGTVAHEGEGGALEALVFEGVGEAGAERDLAADDAVAAPEIARRVEVVHRAALALGAAGVFAVVLRHHLVHAHADGERVAVVAVGGDDVVVLAHDGHAADGDGFLPDVEVEEAADLALLVAAQAALLEAADAHHVAVERDQLVMAELGVDGGLPGIIASDFGLFGGSGFLGHREIV
jgi:hypothetical protein